ncbi:MAG: Flp pilus assembly protein CpaB [Candidatus Binatia bacterium]
MQSRLPILVSLVVAVAAVILTNVYINEIRRESRPPTTGVVVATKNLSAGAFLEESDIAYGERFTSATPKFAISWGERNLYIGQELRFNVAKGDYVLASYFGADVAADRTLSQKIDAKLNQRAMTIPVDNEMALEGSIRPGDRIDLLITYERVPAPTRDQATTTAPRLTPEIVTVPLLENVFVLATGRFGGGGAQDVRYRSITLLVSPDEAKLVTWGMALTQSSALAKLSVLLRNPNDLRSTNRGAIAGTTTALKDLEKIPPIPIADVIKEDEGAAIP